MATFKFSLQQLLDVRDRMERIKKGEFLEVKRDHMKQKKRLMDMRGERSKFHSEQREGRKDRLDIAVMEDFYRFARELEDMLAEVKKKEAEMESLKDEKQQELLCAQKEKKIVEKLKEREFFRFKKAMRKQEIKKMNEVARIQYCLRRPEEREKEREEVQ